MFPPTWAGEDRNPRGGVSTRDFRTLDALYGLPYMAWIKKSP
jgi:hypothetical protein